MKNRIITTPRHLGSLVLCNLVTLLPWFLGTLLPCYFATSVLPCHAVNIETDRSWYLAGETMTVSVAADDALIAYAELCDVQGLAAGAVVSLQQGTGSGVIQLPAHLHSGYYVLSAYTRHDTTVVHRLIAVVNPLHKSPQDDIQWIPVAHSDSLSGPTPDASNGFTLSDLVSSKPSGEREAEGHIIMARIKAPRATGTVAASLSIVGKQIHYFEGQMLDDTTALFRTYGLHGKLPLVLAAKTATGESLPIELLSPFAGLLPRKLPHLAFHYNRSEVEARSLSMQRHLAALAPAKSKTQQEAADGATTLPYDETAFGTKPDPSYNLDEYRQFLTVREVLFEYVGNVRNRKVNGKPQLSVRGELFDYNDLPSLVLIDGMPVSDIERLLSYDARRVHHINIYANQYTFGNDIYNGILSIVTRSGRLTNYPIEQNMQYLVYNFPF